MRLPRGLDESKTRTVHRLPIGVQIPSHVRFSLQQTSVEVYSIVQSLEYELK